MLGKVQQLFKKKSTRLIGLLVLVPIVLFLILNFLFPLPTSLNYSQIVTDNNNNILHAYLTKDDKWRMYTELSEISPELKTAIIHKEDKYFYWHFGINPIAITRALYNNIRFNKRTSGASTITMQVARMLRPKRRTYANKIIELFNALQLEWKFSKDEILQFYLNLVPYGGNIEGVKSASVLYFNKMPNHLSLAEITALSIIPNRPNSMVLGKHNELIVKERNKWLNRFSKDKVFPISTIDDALEEPLVAKRLSAPKLAPHFSNRLKYQYPNEAIIKSTLDINYQNKSEGIVAEYARRLKAIDIHNAAVIVIDNKTKEVLSYVGSADFNSNDDGGQVDGVRAIRQPGSTLKPLVYGLAFDQGLLTPKSVVTDVAVNYNGYSPTNFDKEYHGYVSIEYALAQSLNIPAVKALNMLGVSVAVLKLIDANFKIIERQKGLLGLSLVLGGCGVSLEEMSGLYAAFADKGIYHPLIMNFSDESSRDTTEIVSEETAFMISEILTQLERPDLPNFWRNAANLPLIAWKTGTSYGRRDAWSIGYNDVLTIGVWVGNFSGEGVPELTGASKATPLLFNLFNALDQEKNKSWLTAPKSLPFRLVCADSGLPPGPKCSNEVFDYYLPLKSSMAQCEHLIKIYVAANDSFSYCSHCMPEAGYKEKWMHDHPNEMLAYYKYYGLQFDEIPPHNGNCDYYLDKGNAPEISAPTDGGVYYVNSGEVEEMVFQCQAASNVEKVFWYVNDVFYKETGKHESVLWEPSPGKFKISCSDDTGQNMDIDIEINFIQF